MIARGIQHWSAYATLVAALLCALLSLGGCAGSSYEGISLKVGAADPELQSIARRAQAGDKHAQLELGIRFEEGKGVAHDLELAKKLYRSAAASGGAQHVYAPAIGAGGPRPVLEVAGVSAVTGLVEARTRLARLTAGPGQSRTPVQVGALGKTEMSQQGLHSPGPDGLETSLDNREIWRRLVRMALEARPPEPIDISEIFGIDPEYTTPSARARILKPAYGYAAPFFYYRLWNCETAARVPPVGDLCTGSGTVAEVRAYGPFGFVAKAAERTETDCPRNGPTVAALQAVGWVLKERPDMGLSTHPDVLMRTPDELVRQSGRIRLEPLFTGEDDCVTALEIFLFKKAGQS